MLPCLSVVVLICEGVPCTVIPPNPLGPATPSNASCTYTVLPLNWMKLVLSVTGIEVPLGP